MLEIKVELACARLAEKSTQSKEGACVRLFVKGEDKYLNSVFILIGFWLDCHVYSP